jgi:hypothetical protein
MTPLLLPVPQVSWKTGAAPQLEQPVELGLPALAYPDGAPLDPRSGLATLGVFVYRSAGAGEDLWNEEEQQWQPAPAGLEALAALKPLALVPASRKNAPHPWQSVLVAAGQTDKDQARRFAAAVGGTPRYRVRAYAAARRGETQYAGLSAASADLAFVSAEEQKRFVVVMEPESIQECGRVRLQLRNASLQEAAFIELRAASGREVEISTRTGSGAQLARVLLEASGDIRLEPAPGRRILLGGDLEAERVLYLPQGDTVKRYL